MSWRAQALVWPGVRSLLYIAVLVVGAPGSWDWVVLAVVAPIAAAGSVFLFGGFAVATALFVRVMLRALWPDSPVAVRRCLVAAATGTVLFTVWLAIWTSAGAGAVSVAMWLHTAAIGTIAAFASALYTRALFDKPVAGGATSNVSG